MLTLKYKKGFYFRFPGVLGLQDLLWLNIKEANRKNHFYTIKGPHSLLASGLYKKKAAKVVEQMIRKSG